MALECGFEALFLTRESGRMYYAEWQNVLCKMTECTMQNDRMYYANLARFLHRILTPFVKMQKKNGVITRRRNSGKIHFSDNSFQNSENSKENL
jgi:hypothetical protein